jgi:hypothetical protein
MKWSRGSPVSCTGRLTTPTGHPVPRANATRKCPLSRPPCRLHLLPRSSPAALSTRVGWEEKSSPASPSALSSASSVAPLATALSCWVPPPSSPLSASTWMGHSGQPSAPSPQPWALQPLRGPHRPPHRLPRPVVYPYHHRSPPLTHATADELTGEHPSSPLPPNWSPILLCRSSRPWPAPLLGITGNWPAPLPVAMELPPLPLFDRGPPTHGWPASLDGPDGLGRE